MDTELDCQGVKVLVVDDSIIHQEIMRLFFEDVGIVGDCAMNGKDAINKIQKSRYDLCLMDLTMPDMDGFKTTEIIRETLSKELPIFAVSGLVNDFEQSQGKHSGITDWIAKPVNLKDLRHKIFRYTHIKQIKKKSNMTLIAEKWMEQQQDLIIELMQENKELIQEIKDTRWDCDKTSSSIKEIYRELKKSLKISEGLRQELGKHKDKAEAATRAKSSFLANMSHEIRTPMNSVLGFASLLQKTPLTSKQQEHLNIITSSGKLLLNIINDILDISKFESGKMDLEWVDFDIRGLIADTFRIITSRMTDNPLDTYFEVANDVPENIKGDPMRLKQVVLNLLGNAIKFTSKGEIGVMVECHPDSKSDESVLLKFTVRDTGIGIPEDKREAIFESFAQADSSTTRQFGGTGLGLSISKSIVSAMCGTIWVESEYGKGSSFIFTARFRRASSSVSKDIIQILKETLRCKKVLIIDDNRISRAILKKCCTELDMDILSIEDSAFSAIQRLDEMLKQRKVPDIILCDIMMATMDGYTFAKKVRLHKEFKDVKIVAVTADINVEVNDSDGKVVFNDYVLKPVTFSNLADTIAYVLNDSESKDADLDNKKQESQLGGCSKRNPHDPSKIILPDNLLDCIGIRVLVAEDSFPNQMLVQAYFEQLGCQGDYAANGSAAVEKIRNNQYDLCLMDVQMPVMNGFEATRVIRQELKKTLPIIALTAAVLKEDREQAKAVGMDDFLAKPLDIEKLRETIIKYGRVK